MNIDKENLFVNIFFLFVFIFRNFDNIRNDASVKLTKKLICPKMPRRFSGQVEWLVSR